MFFQTPSALCYSVPICLVRAEFESWHLIEYQWVLLKVCMVWCDTKPTCQARRGMLIQFEWMMVSYRYHTTLLSPGVSRRYYWLYRSTGISIVHTVRQRDQSAHQLARCRRGCFFSLALTPHLVAVTHVILLKAVRLQNTTRTRIYVLWTATAHIYRCFVVYTVLCVVYTRHE